MTGGNCAIPGCATSRRAGYEGISLFKVTKRKGEFYVKWRENIVAVLRKYREFDKEFKKRIESGDIFICERHYGPSQIEYTATGKKTPCLGAVPTQNFPEKSHETVSKPRKEPANRVNSPPGPTFNPDSNASSTESKTEFKPKYTSFEAYLSVVKKFNRKDWTTVITDTSVSFKLFKENILVPAYSVLIDKELHVTIAIFGWILPDGHDFYLFCNRTVSNITTSELLNKLVNSYELCPGKTALDAEHLSKDFVVYNLPLDLDLHTSQRQSEGYIANNIMRHKHCILLMEKGLTQCSPCSTVSIKKTYSNINIPAKPKAPLSQTHPNRVRLALQNERAKTKQLEKEISKMKAQIKEIGVDISSDFESDLNNIIESNKESISPFMKLFWEQQKSERGKGTSARFHPMIIRFCLSLASKSASAYDELRETNVLTLPSRRTLRDYRNAIKPATGFNPPIIKELMKQTKNLEGAQRYVCMSIDEVKVKEDLVYSKHSGELVGFVDLGNPELDYSTFSEVDSIATHACVFYIRGIASDLKFAFSYFSTTGITALQLMPLFWDAVCLLELVCKLPVIACVSDGAEANRKFYRMHHLMDDKLETSVVYRTINLYARDRFIWFLSDAPHLMKTARNSHYASGKEGKKRNMWNNGKEIVWNHILKLYRDDQNRGLKLVHKLKDENVFLNSYSVMNVRLAAQVLSQTCGKVLYKYYPEQFHGTAEFCLMINKFFDCLNVRHQDESNHYKNEDIAPYTSIDDDRLTWLTGDFLDYFKRWKDSIEKFKGDLSNEDKQFMFIADKTYQGLQITCYSIVEIVKYLLTTGGMKFVLTEKFNQDVLEEYFGRHRSLGRRNDNPTIYQLGYQSNVIRIQRCVVPVRGNTEGKHRRRGKRVRSWSVVDNEPLDKRRTEKTAKRQRKRK